MTELINKINERFWHKNGGFPAALPSPSWSPGLLSLSPLTNHPIGWTAKGVHCSPT
jgi:hypothetical protein